jgi:hypothetical protein
MTPASDAEMVSAVGGVVAAVATLGTLLVAVIAALYAKHQVEAARGQLAESERMRAEQAQPYVVVDFTISARMYAELTIKNIGTTAARDVTVTFTPQIRSTLIESGRAMLLDSSLIKRGIPTLPPGKEYRLMFESMPALYKREDLPRCYEAVVHFADSSGKTHEGRFTLDLNTYYGYRSISIYTMHEAAQALQDIRTEVRKWKEGPAIGGLRVWTRDADAKDRREMEEYQRWQAERDRSREAAAGDARGESERMAGDPAQSTSNDDDFTRTEID